MGCVTSAEARRDMVWVGGDPRRAGRSFSMSSVDRQPLRSRAVSMLGTLGLAGNNSRHAGSSYKYRTLSLSLEEMMKSDQDRAVEVVALPGEDDAAKRRVKPCTPTLTPPNEPEVINAWELMAGLEEGPTPRAVRPHSLSLDAPGLVTIEAPPPPPWMQVDMDIPIALDFDPEILSVFREAMEETSPSPQPTVVSSAEEKPVQRERSKDVDTMSPATGDMPELSGIVRARIKAFQEKIERRRSGGGARDPKAVSPQPPPGGERKAVVYFTSLRGVRKTFVDCCAVRSILRSYAVRLDERDVSMHAGFKAELADLLGGCFAAGVVTLPRVFVDGRYLGGAEDVQYLHEAGELGRALEGCEAAPFRKLGYMEACAACGDVRFVPCETCYGSCKIFVVEDQDDTYNDAGEFRRCSDCNENGLIRCPVCCC
jgi:glutaredoxin domain-containing cysteine-rich protein 1